MKHSILKIALAVLALTLSVTAQTMNGTITRVIDGNTVTLRLASGEVRIGLQFIESPSGSHPLTETVKNHLSNLTLGKQVTYRPRSISGTGSFGQIMVGGVDISQQLLRDGAAWLIPYEMSGQPSSEHKAYAAMELAAKEEKRGIWASPDLKPSWLQHLMPAPSAMKAETKAAAERPKGKFSDKNPNLGNVGALVHGYNAESRTGYLSTTPLGVNVADNSPWSGSSATVDITYLYQETAKGRVGKFFLTIVRVANTSIEASNKDIAFLDQPKKIIARANRRAYRDALGRHWETLRYELPRSAMERLVNESEIKILIGKFSPDQYSYSYNYVQPAYGYQILLLNMLDLSR